MCTQSKYFLYVYKYICTHLCAEARGQDQVSSSIHLSIIFYLSLNLQFTNLLEWLPPAPQASRILMSLLLQLEL